MKRSLTRIAAVLFVTVLLAGCGAGEYTARGAGDYVARLESEGLSLVPAGVANNRAFTVTGQQYDVSRGGTLHIYEYESESMAAADATNVQGGVASNAHVYQEGNVVVVYFGTDLSTQTTLANVFGPQIF